MGSSFCAGMSWRVIMPAGWNAPWLLDWHSDGLLDGWAGTAMANLSHTKKERPPHTPLTHPPAAKLAASKPWRGFTHQWDVSLIRLARSQAAPPLFLSWTITGLHVLRQGLCWWRWLGRQWNRYTLRKCQGCRAATASHLLAIGAAGLILKSHAGHRTRSLRPIRNPTVSRHYFPAASMRQEGIGKSLYSTLKRKDFFNDVKVIMGVLSGLENPRNKLRWWIFIFVNTSK